MATGTVKAGETSAAARYVPVDYADPIVSPERMRVLWISSAGFALLFAAWTMFGVLGILIKKEMRLTEVQFSWLTAIAILNGAIWRLPLGALADALGGRIVFFWTLVFAGLASLLTVHAGTYPQLMVCAFLVGIAGNSFSVGSAWNAAWFPPKSHGFAMGFFGAGNVGASMTKFIGPALIASVPAAGMLGGLVPGGWRFIPFLYGCLILAMAALTWLASPTPDHKPAVGRTVAELARPLREVRVWRFSLYYTIVFGAYVALSVVLPNYYVTVYGLPLAKAALLTTPFILASSLLRPLGGVLADRYGPRRVTYVVFIVGMVGCWLLTRPLSLYPFTALVLLVGVTQGIGKASTIKYIPEYYPNDVGVVVGLVGALAAIGGFAMPPLFAYLKLWTGVPQAMFWLLFVLTATGLGWLHVVVRRLHRTEGASI